MQRPWLYLAGLAVVGVLAPASRADVVVRAPFVRVEVGPVVSVRVPFVNVAYQRRIVLPPDPGAPPPVPVMPVPARPRETDASFASDVEAGAKKR